MNKYSKYLVLKSAMENIFGQDAWYSLKESNHVPTWRKYAEKMLKAIEFSIKDTVDIYDEEWILEIEGRVNRGLESLKRSKEIDEIISVLAGTLVNVTFLQIGHMPHRSGTRKTYSLRKGKWRFNSYRSVVYLQTKEQKENLFIDKQRVAIGFEAQFDLMSEYRRSKSKLAYVEWCKEREKALQIAQVHSAAALRGTLRSVAAPRDAPQRCCSAPLSKSVRSTGMEFAKEYGFLALIALILLTVMIAYGNRHAGSKGRLLSGVIIAGMGIPPLLINQDQELAYSIYSLFLGTVFLVAYFKTNSALVFKGLEGVCVTLFFPKSKNWLLPLGIFCVAYPIIDLLLGA